VDRARLLCLVVVLGIGISLADPAIANAVVHSAPCTQYQIRFGTCVSGNINGGGVDLSGHTGAPGSGSGKPGGKGKGKPPAPICQGLPAACQKIIVIPPGAPGNPGVTINDLKNFPAIPGTDHMEPNGWMVVGLDTNFYSVVGVETVNGILLGQPASVRFTPVAWHWTYGDTTGATRGAPGTTWAAQGIPEFDPTPTSHVYRAEGTYFIDLSITFTADYKYATGNWTHVLGTITLPANRLEATAGDAKTVLVNRDCTQNPSGPGC
jgi:hypothetical protein